MARASNSIAVVGNINIDTKTGLIPAGARLQCDGETSVSEIYETIGGGGANTAVAAAKMGGDVHFFGAIGADTPGNRIRTYLSACGVKAHLAIKPAPTGHSLALNWEGHQRHFVSCLPSSLLLEPADIDLNALAIAGCNQLYRADIWFAPKMLEEGNLQLLRGARRIGMQTSIDINWDPHWNSGRDDQTVCRRISAVTRLLPEVTYVHGNLRELCFFAQSSTIAEAARWYFDHGAQTMLVHMGRDGSAAMNSSGMSIQIPAVPVERVVSETGTGDIFTAAFLLRSGMELPHCLAECNAVASTHLSGSAKFLPPLE